MKISQEKLLGAMRKAYPIDQLNQEQQKILAEKAEALVYKSGKNIYLQGTVGEYIYLVIEGVVEIPREHNGKIQIINAYKPFSVFGIDAISPNPVRRTSARSKTDSLVIRLSAVILKKMLSQTENLTDVFDQVVDSYNLTTKIDLEGRKPDETVLFTGRSFPINLLLYFLISFICIVGSGRIIYQILFPKGLFVSNLIITTGCIGLIVVIANLIPYVNWRRSIYIVTDQRVISKELSILIFENRHEMGIDEIVSVSNRSNILGRLFGYGDLLINSYTGSLGLRNIRKSSCIQEFLEGIQKMFNELKILAKRETYDAIVADRISSPNGVGSTFNDTDPRNLGDWNLKNKPSFIDKLLGLKVFIGDRILFRTHWIELFKRVLIPSVLLISFLIFVLYMSIEQIPWTENQFVFFFLFISMVFGAFWWIYQFLDWRNDRFIITKDQIIDIDQRPFGFENKRTAPINRIQSIRYKRLGLSGLLFNYGTVYIRIGDDELTFDHVHDPLSVQQEIFQRLEQVKKLNEEKTLRNQRDQVVNLIEAYQRITPKKQSKL